MKTMKHILGTLLWLAAWAAVAGAETNPNALWDEPPVREIPRELKAFATAKEAQAKDLAKRLKLELAPDVLAFFAAVKKGEAAESLTLWNQLSRRAGQYTGSTSDPTVSNPAFSTVLEVDLGLEQFTQGEAKYCYAFQ
jgi:hypothetical protein